MPGIKFAVNSFNASSAVTPAFGASRPLEPWVLDGRPFRFRVDDLEGFADLIFRPDHAVQGIGQALVAEDHDGRRGLVRCEEVVYETERKSRVDGVNVEDLLMAAFERSGPIRAVRRRRLGVRR